MPIVATCGHAAIVHLTRELGATHIQEAMVRLCYNYKGMVNPDEVMDWAAEGGQGKIMRRL